MRPLFVCAIAAAVFVSIGADALAQTSPAASAQPTPPAPVPNAEREQNLINVPTTQPLRRHGSYFRLTHRFARDLRRGSFGQLVEDLFSLDNGAIIGLEYRFAPTSKTQTGIHRSLLFRTIQVFGRYDVLREGGGVLPVSMSVVASVEGTNNMRDDHAPGLGLAFSHGLGDRVMLYATPVYVWNTSVEGATGVEGHDHDLPSTGEPAVEHSDDIFFVGLGGRLRLRPTVYVAGEYSPRGGNHPGRGAWGVAIEKHTGGHTFQLNFTNTFGTTYGQTARGGDTHNVYLGFNLVRRF
jgi:uncharacterized beta barrel domain-containing protein DUF5777